MSATQTPGAAPTSAQARGLPAARDLPRARGAVSAPTRRRRHFARAVGADRAAGAGNSAAAGARPRARRQAGARARSAIRSRARSRCSTSGPPGACPASRRCRCWSSSPPTSASAWSASTRRTGRERSPLPRPLRQSVRRGRRRRQRPRLHRMGRLRRAGDVRDRPRRPHRLQADRPDHAAESGNGAQAGKSRRRWRLIKARVESSLRDVVTRWRRCFPDLGIAQQLRAGPGYGAHIFERGQRNAARPSFRSVPAPHISAAADTGPSRTGASAAPRRTP